MCALLNRVVCLAIPMACSAFSGALSASSAQPDVAVWMQGLYAEADQKRRAGLSGYEVAVESAGVGITGRLSEYWQLSLDYRAITAEVQQGGQAFLEIDSEFIKATASVGVDRYVLDFGLSHGSIEHHSVIPAQENSGTVWAADALLGYRYPLQGTVTVEPLLQLRYSRSEMDAKPLHEIGEVGLGLRWTGHFQVGPGRLEQRIRWMALRDHIADSSGGTTLVMLGDQPVVTHPAQPEKHSYLAGLGMRYYLGELTLSATYDYLERANYYANHLAVEVRYSF